MINAEVAILNEAKIFLINGYHNSNKLLYILIIPFKIFLAVTACIILASATIYWLLVVSLSWLLTGENLEGSIEDKPGLTHLPIFYSPEYDDDAGDSNTSVVYGLVLLVGAIFGGL